MANSHFLYTTQHAPVQNPLECAPNVFSLGPKTFYSCTEDWLASRHIGRSRKGKTGGLAGRLAGRTLYTQRLTSSVLSAVTENAPGGLARWPLTNTVHECRMVYANKPRRRTKLAITMTAGACHPAARGVIEDLKSSLVQLGRIPKPRWRLVDCAALHWPDARTTSWER